VPSIFIRFIGLVPSTLLLFDFDFDFKKLNDYIKLVNANCRVNSFVKKSYFFVDCLVRFILYYIHMWLFFTAWGRESLFRALVLDLT
jgi:hypothetical protein